MACNARKTDRATQRKPTHGQYPTHERMTINSKFERIARLPEYRGLSNIEKALLLINNHQCSLNQATTATGVGKSRIRRAIEAKKSNRPIGKNERSKVLGDNGEAYLVAAAIKEADEKRVSLTYVQLRERVYYTPSTLISLFLCITPHNTHI